MNEHARSWFHNCLPVVLALVVSAAASLAAEAPQAPAPPGVMTVWAADPSVKIDPEGKPLVLSPLPDYRSANAVWNAATGTVTLAAARNEYASFQILVEAAKAPLKGVTVTPSDLLSGASRIPADRFAFYGECYTQVTQPSRSPAQSAGPGLYPDALIPMTLEGYKSFAVDAGATQALWVDLYVPKDAAAAAYTGAVTVTDGSGQKREMKISLQVWDFTLPAESHLRWRIGYTEQLAAGNNVPFDRNTSKVGEEFLALELEFYRLCRAHRVTPTTHYTSPLPDSQGKGAGLTIDWASYDRRFSRYLDGSAFDDGLPVNIFSLPVNPQSYNGWPSSTRYRNNLDIESFKKAIKLTVEHWKEKGWSLENAFVYIADEPNESRAEIIKEHCQAVKDASPAVHRSVALYRIFGANGPNIVNAFRGYINYWEIAGDYMYRPALANVQKDGDWVGIYQGSEPFEGGEALDMDGLALTTWPWIAWMYKLDSLFIYNSTEWNTKDIWTEPRNHGWVTNSQGVLFYPGLKVGVKRALPSIRLKEMRLGMQDYEYMWLLNKAGKGDLADKVAKEIIRVGLGDAAAGYGDRYFGPGKWERDPAKWFAARREMAEAIAAAQAK